MVYCFGGEGKTVFAADIKRSVYYSQGNPPYELQDKDYNEENSFI